MTMKKKIVSVGNEVDFSPIVSPSSEEKKIAMK